MLCAHPKFCDACSRLLTAAAACGPLAAAAAAAAAARAPARCSAAPRPSGPALPPARALTEAEDPLAVGDDRDAHVLLRQRAQLVQDAAPAWRAARAGAARGRCDAAARRAERAPALLRLRAQPRLLQRSPSPQLARVRAPPPLPVLSLVIECEVHAPGLERQLVVVQARVTHGGLRARRGRQRCVLICAADRPHGAQVPPPAAPRSTRARPLSAASAAARQRARAPPPPGEPSAAHRVHEGQYLLGVRQQQRVIGARVCGHEITKREVPVERRAQLPQARHRAIGRRRRRERGRRVLHGEGVVGRRRCAGGGGARCGRVCLARGCLAASVSACAALGAAAPAGARSMQAQRARGRSAWHICTAIHPSDAPLLAVVDHLAHQEER